MHQLIIGTAKAYYHWLNQNTILHRFSTKALARRINQFYLSIYERLTRIILKIRST